MDVLTGRVEQSSVMGNRDTERNVIQDTVECDSTSTASPAARFPKALSPPKELYSGCQQTSPPREGTEHCISESMQGGSLRQNSAQVESPKPRLLNPRSPQKGVAQLKSPQPRAFSPKQIPSPRAVAFLSPQSGSPRGKSAQLDLSPAKSATPQSGTRSTELGHQSPEVNYSNSDDDDDDAETYMSNSSSDEAEDFVKKRQRNLEANRAFLAQIGIAQVDVLPHMLDASI